MGGDGGGDAEAMAAAEAGAALDSVLSAALGSDTVTTQCADAGAQLMAAAEIVAWLSAALEGVHILLWFFRGSYATRSLSTAPCCPPC